MTCEHCGGAMELAPSRRHFTCAHCGKSRFPDPLAADGIQLVGRSGDAVTCPVCATAMSHALLHDEPVEFCTECRGMLLPRGTFAELVDQHRAWATSPPVAPAPLRREALDRRLFCPECAAAFATYPYGGPGNAVIDGCPRCDLVWLDYGELAQIIDAPGRDRGRLS